MAQVTPARWNPTQPGRPVGRLEVWSRGFQVASVDQSELLSGTVKDDNKNGLRRTLSVTVDPSAKWLRWAKLPGLELRPFAGMAWGQSDHVMPMGRFPVLPPSVSQPASEVQFQGADYWQWMMDNDFSSFPSQAPAGALTKYAAQQLILESKLPYGDEYNRAIVTSTSLDVIPAPVIFDKTASDACIQMCESIAAAVFVDRLGNPTIQDRVVEYGRPLLDGDLGTVIDISSTDNWAEARNFIVIRSSSDTVKFEPVTWQIEDPSHPAHDSKIGVKRFTYESPLFTTREQAIQAAPFLLAAKANKAGAWAVTALADPSVDAGDVVNVDVQGWEPFQAVIQSVTHDLAGDDMKLTLGAV